MFPHSASGRSGNKHYIPRTTHKPRMKQFTQLCVAQSQRGASEYWDTTCMHLSLDASLHSHNADMLKHFTAVYVYIQARTDTAVCLHHLVL